MDEKPSYYAIIPADVRYDKRLKPMEKLLYAEISSLQNMKGECFASNEYFAELYECTTKAISCYIRHLKECGYIDADYERDGSVVTKRVLKTTNVNVPKVKVQKTKTEKKTETKEPKEKKVPLLEREPENDMERVEKIYLQNYRTLYERGIVQTENPVLNWGASRKMLAADLKAYGVELMIKAVQKSIDDDFVVQGGYALTTILSAGVLARLLNGSKQRKNQSIMGTGVDEYKDNGVDF